MIRARLWIVLSVCVVFYCSRSAHAACEVAIRGSVTAVGTENPIKNATVHVVQVKGNWSQSTTTDERGNFEVCYSPSQDGETLFFVVKIVAWNFENTKHEGSATKAKPAVVEVAMDQDFELSSFLRDLNDALAHDRQLKGKSDRELFDEYRALLSAQLQLGRARTSLASEKQSLSLMALDKSSITRVNERLTWRSAAIYGELRKRFDYGMLPTGENVRVYLGHETWRRFTVETVDLKKEVAGALGGRNWDAYEAGVYALYKSGDDRKAIAMVHGTAADIEEQLGVLTTDLAQKALINLRQIDYEDSDSVRDALMAIASADELLSDLSAEDFAFQRKLMTHLEPLLLDKSRRKNGPASSDDR